MKKNIRAIVGNIRINLKGTGFIKTENGKKDVEIRFESLNTALNGDTVKVSIIKKGHDRDFGKVLEILKRSKRGYAGEVLRKNKDFFLKPSDPRMYTLIKIDDNKKIEIGDKAFVTIKKWTDSKKQPLGKIIKVLGKAGEHEAEMQGIILERGFESSFPKEIEIEAKKLKEKEHIKTEEKVRKDFRDITTFTIDPEDAKDFDDALSIKTLKNKNFEVGIHIADVSYYVKPKTKIDSEALDRATSVYLVDRTIPMLPEVLSNDLCSLNPKEDKLCFSAVFELDNKGNVLKEWFGRTIINSDKRFTYEEAQKVLDDKRGIFFEELNILNNIAKNLTKKRIDDGAILMETEEVKFKLDENGKPIAVYIKSRQDTNKLIEEFMLLANKRVAMFGAKDAKNNNRLFLYRVHDKPDKEKISDLKDYLDTLGYEFNERRGYVAPEEFNKLFKELEGKSEKDTVQSVVIRSMQKAIYSTKNISHYGLAFPFYTHFTSPIRRYPDIIVHRLLDLYLQGKKLTLEQASFYEQKAKHCTDREIEAAEAERASIKYKQIEYMSEHIGDEFEGIISGMNEWSVYITEKTTHTEGLIKIRDIKDDHYSYDVKKMVLIGKNSSKILRIGDKFKIKVAKVDIEKQTVDYEIAD